MAGIAIQAGSTADVKLTSNPDHSVGADQMFCPKSGLT